MRLAIIGSGSLASFFAARLSSYVDLVMLGHWPEQIARLQNHGLELIHLDGATSHHQFHVISDSAAAAPVDVALILVKSYQTKQAAFDAISLLAEEGLAITLQNGLGNKELLDAMLGENRVIQGVTTLGANMVAPGSVRHAGLGKVYFAESASSTSQKGSILFGELTSLMNLAGLDTVFTADVTSLVWGKLAVNAGINPLTALLRVQNGFLVKNNLARSLMVGAAEEVARVALELDIELPYENAGEEAIKVASQTAENYSSMLQDILRQAPTENDAICGKIVKHGQLTHTPTPINYEFWRLVGICTNDYRNRLKALGQIDIDDMNNGILRSNIKELDILLSTVDVSLNN